MKFIANTINGNYLANVLPPPTTEVDGVYAAIAYGSSSSNESQDLIGNCLRNKLRLDIWMRYDHTIPVAIPLLKRILTSHSSNIFCRLIPDRLHSKVIWWKGYGAYIGSANLSDRAWMTNIEAGVFFTEEELAANNMLVELESFFDWLKMLDVSMPLSSEIIQEMEDIQKARSGIYEKGKDKRSTPEWPGPAFIGSRQNINEQRKEHFRKEWHETLTTLRSIGDQLKNHKPSWVADGTPINWQVDQFLHAYYYNKVSDGLRRPYEEFYQKHKSIPQTALTKAIKWWCETDAPPSNEDQTFDESAPFIRHHLSKNKLLSLDKNSFGKICLYTHATKDHIAKIPVGVLGKPERNHLKMEERIPLFADWIWTQKNQKGWNILELIYFVLYGGDSSSLWERLYLAGRTDEYHLPRYGLNSLAEITGWARPEVAPPRNGRTSKALRALGYDVKLY